jgi:lysophospholipase
VTKFSRASNNFSSVEQLRADVNLTANYLKGPAGNQTAHVASAFKTASEKARSGLPVSITDILGQFFKQYLPASWEYKNFSNVADADHAFSSGLSPMPIVLYSEVVPGHSPEIGGIMYPGVNSTNLTIYEQTPFEFGSWVGGRVQAFMPTRYLGTAMHNGTPIASNHCITGFDKMTFTQGGTGNAWNFWFIDDFYNIPLFYKRDANAPVSDAASPSANSSIPIPLSQTQNPLVVLVNSTANIFNQTFNQSMWATYPNPFQNYNKEMGGVKELLVVRDIPNLEQSLC